MGAHLPPPSQGVAVSPSNSAGTTPTPSSVPISGGPSVDTSPDTSNGSSSNGSWAANHPGVVAGIVGGVCLVSVAAMLLYFRKRLPSCRKTGTHQVNGDAPTSPEGQQDPPPPEHHQSGDQEPGASGPWTQNRPSDSFAFSPPSQEADPTGSTQQRSSSGFRHSGTADLQVPSGRPRNSGPRSSLISWTQNGLFGFRSRANSTAGGTDGGSPAEAGGDVDAYAAAPSSQPSGRVGHISQGGPSNPAMLQAMARAVLQRPHWGSRAGQHEQES